MYPVLLTLQVRALGVLAHTTDHAAAAVRRRRGTERGQSTAEYALVLLGAATVALVFLAWAGRTDRIENLFDAVLDTVIGKV